MFEIVVPVVIVHTKGGQQCTKTAAGLHGVGVVAAEPSLADHKRLLEPGQGILLVARLKRNTQRGIRDTPKKQRLEYFLVLRPT